MRVTSFRGKVLGLRVQGLGFRVQRFGRQGLGFRLVVGESRTRRRGFSATFQGFQAFKLPNHNNVRVPRAYGSQSIHAQTIITFVFQEHTGLRASMPKP